MPSAPSKPRSSAIAWPGVDAVLDLADRAERAVETEIVGDRLHDLLERRGHDVHGLAAVAMALDEVERLGIDQGAQNPLHRVLDERAHLLRGEAAQDPQPVDSGAAHGLVTGAARHEEQLPRGRLRDLTA